MSTPSIKIEGEIHTFDSKSGIFAGFMMENKFNDKVALQVELLYVNLGGELSSYLAGQDFTYEESTDLNMQSLQLPIGI